MIINQYQRVPYMKSLSSWLNKMASDGYSEEFQVKEEGLVHLKTDTVYTPEQVNVINFFRFEGVSDPDDMAILYVLETSDGHKGTLIDAFGTYSDSTVNDFMLAVQQIAKKTSKED